MTTRRGLPARGAASSDIDVDDELQQLLKEQEDFMRQRARPAAKITRVGAAAAAAPSPMSSAPVAEKEAKKEDETLDDGPQVVGSVKERDVISLDSVGGVDRRVLQAPRATSGGFPAVRKRGESLFGRRARQQQQSDAAQAGGASKLSGNGKIVERAPSVVAAAQATQIVEPSSARSDVASADEWKEIDETNAAALRNMSTADIRAAQQELYSMLDPELLAKLKSRRQPTAKKPVKQTQPEGNKRNDVVAATRRLAAAGIDLSKIETEEQLFIEAAKLPDEERAKHAWMQPVGAEAEETQPSTSTKTGTAKKSRLPVRANAPKRPDSKASGERFDFNGDVVVASATDGAEAPAPPSHSGLYHHGDDPEAAGYTMDELLHLARSTVASQRTVALITISKILRKRQSQPAVLAPEVLPAELPIALRMALDDQNYTALSAAITALHAFLCTTETNDVAFESSHGSVVATPRIHLHVDVGTTQDELLREVIYIDTAESEEDGSKIGDQELCSLDPVQGLLKMTIVTRLCYVITTIQLPDEDAMDKLLDILIHIAAHSPRAAQAVAADRKLMKALQSKYLENECVLTLQTEPADEFEQAAARTLKTLRLVRVLCQGSRAVAGLFVESGIIQTTKGFLALRADQVAGLSSDPLGSIQLESLRVWRVLLGYGLDFHCFSYLYPLLCGFDGVNLVRDKSDAASGVARWSDRCLAAIFAALDAFARLDTIHEAQHYLNQFGFFLQLASDEIARRVPLLFEQNATASDPVPTVALRFLTTCCALVNKFHLDRRPFTATFKLLQTQLRSAAWRDRLVHAPDGAELLVAITTFGAQTIEGDLIGDDEDEEDVRKQFFLRWKPLALSLISQSSTTKDTLCTCELILAAADSFLRSDHHDDEFIRSIYAAALSLVQDLKPGHQFWIRNLFTQVLFNPIVLQKTGFFPEPSDATAMGRVLIPIYQALVNSTKEQEEHSQQLFARRSSPKQQQTCHLVDPQDEHSYVGSNLPLPFFWMFCPFSRMEYASQANANADSQKQKHAATSLGPSHAEAAEMRVIVSAACRYIDQLESIVGTVRSLSSATTFGDEDRLFHLMHVFFAGTDVLFDEYVDLALSKLLKKYALSVIHSENPTAFYDGMLRNLRQFESIEAGEQRAAPKQGAGVAPKSFTTETQTVMTFVERLVNEFTSSSFGNTHFARLVTLFMLHDFPLEIRKWVWKELAGSHLLHRLEPFGGTEARAATGQRATRDANHSDETLVRAMTQAIATRQQQGVVSHERGPFAYWLAIHHTAAYVFGADEGHDRNAELSFARQKLLQDLTANAPRLVWRHLLSHDTTTFAPTANAEIKQTRVDRVLQRAGFSDAQATAFRLASEEP